MGSNRALATNVLAAAFVAGASGCAPAVAQITLDGSMGTGGPIPLAGNTYSILQGYGQTRGSNLFHSFGAFGVPTGQIADFQGAGIQNIIARVTGGARSDIDGQIRSSIAGANLFLMNPAGIMFGPNASLNVSGSFHATTSDYIGFANGERFMANQAASGSTLSMSNPSAFGFLGTNASQLVLNGSQLSAANGKTLSFVAQDVDIHANGNQAATLTAPQGTVNLFSLGGAGEIGLDSTTTAPLGGSIRIAGVPNIGYGGGSQTSRVDVAGNGSGNVRVVSGSFTMTDATIQGENTGPLSTDALIKINATNTTINRSSISAATRVSGNGDAADLTILAPGTLNLLDQSVLTVGTGNSTGLPAAPGAPFGKGGDINIVAGDITITGNDPTLPASILSGTTAAGDSGSITINAQNLGMTFANIGVSAVRTGGGKIGDIAVTVANALTMDKFSAISAFNTASETSQPGTITVNAGSMTIKQASRVVTDTSTSGGAGNISVTVRGALLVDGTDPGICTSAASCLQTGITAGVGIDTGAGTATGSGGTLTVNAGSLTILGGGTVSSATQAIGNAGSVTVNVSGTLTIDAKGGVSPTVFDTGAASTFSANFAEISSSTSDVGTAGTIRINTGNLSMTGGANITTSSFGTASGMAGDIQVVAGNIYMSGLNTYIQSQSQANNAAGSISVSASNLTILQDAAITTDTRTNFNAGTINVSVAGALLIDGTGQTGAVTGITSDTVYDPPNNTVFVTGNAGNVTVNAGSITLVNGAQISSNANTYGNAGSVTVNAGAIVIDGPATTGDNFTGIASVANNLTNDANIASRAGNVTINANSLAILRNGQIATDTYTNGDAGTISVNVAGPLLIDGIGQTTKITGIFSDTFSGDGKAGTVNVNAGYGLLANNSKIATETGAAGRGGDIVATFGTLDMNGGASISSASTGDATGNAGSVTVNSPGVITLYGAGTTIQSRAQGTGDAGPILVTADQLILKEGASVTTEAAVGGGGNITMHLDFLLYLLRSSITTTVAGGSGSGGDIFIDPDFVVLNQSTILARAFAGNGGNIRIIAGRFFRSVDSVVDASSTLGISGQISISSPDSDVISGTVNLPTGLGSETKLDQRACVGPGETPVLSLVPVGRGGLLLVPDASQAETSFMLAGRDSIAAPAQQAAAQLRSAELRSAALTQFAALPMAASARNCTH